MATPVTPLASPSRRVYVLLFTHVFTQRLAGREKLTEPE